MRTHRDRITALFRAAAAIGMVAMGAGMVFAAEGGGGPAPGPDYCCFTRCCPDGGGRFDCATHCRSACPSGKTCSGTGTCNPVTAQAQCI